jgi:hypothetical protein
MIDLPGLYERHLAHSDSERPFLGALAFTLTFAAARGITHSIRAGVGPFKNVSAGGQHIHHSTFGILGLLGCGYVWQNRWAMGHPHGAAWASRVAASAYGVASALTLDEFALWLDLHDDYWDKKGRKSIDAVIVFAGLLTMTYAAQDALDELGLIPQIFKRPS